MFNHRPLNPIVLLAIVAPNAAWPAEGLNCLEEQLCHSVRPLVVGAPQVDDHSGVTIHAAVDPEAPWSNLLVGILMPEGIGATDPIDSPLDNSRPP